MADAALLIGLLMVLIIPELKLLLLEYLLIFPHIY